MAAPLGVGLVGAGAYGEFCLAAFAELPDITITAIADTNLQRAETFAAQYGAAAYASLDALLADPAVDIVALNTPPSLHESQGLAVLNAKKHLFCEKPLALTIEGGTALLVAAKNNNVRLTVDYVMRQTPLWAAAAKLRESGILGSLLHMSLINHAAGLNLPPDHWFWDSARSGGIWIEHGVHFFDAFSWVSGHTGEIVSARAFTRADGVTDRVEALARYGSTAAHFYHGFTHSSATEQTTVTLAFERGHVTLREWVPTVLELLTNVDERAVKTILPDCTQWPVGSMTRYTVMRDEKAKVYRKAIQDGIRDLAAAVRTPTASLAVTGASALDSLRMAVEATEATRRTS